MEEELTGLIYGLDTGSERKREIKACFQDLGVSYQLDNDSIDR